VLHASLDADRTSLLQEAALMAQFECERVVGLVGVVTVGMPLMVVIEFCEHGSLDRYLRKTTLTELERLGLAGDCAEGLAYLASRKFVHRDIAARNVLLNSERRAKISDFGLSRETSENSPYYRSKGGEIPVRWTAPEALEAQKFSPASDCWSFGVLMYEIWTKGELPYKGMGNQKVWVEVQSGYRLPCPEDCATDIHSMMLECWHTDPASRPAMSSFVERIQERHIHISRASFSASAFPRESSAPTHEYLQFNEDTKKFVKPASKKASMFSIQSDASNAQGEWAFTIERMNSSISYTEIVGPVEEGATAAQYLDIEPDEVLA
jgi:serine/threonine protein kinase